VPTGSWDVAVLEILAERKVGDERLESPTEAFCVLD
jgi:hypothetical protein